jgi:sugar lactone lactonase YvrE
MLFVLLVPGCAQKGPMEIGTIFYPDPPQQPRIQYLYTLVSESDIGAEKSKFEEFLLGPDVQFEGVIRPYDISSSKGKIYVIDRNYNRVFYFDIANKKLEYIRDLFNPESKILYPGGIWITPDDIKYVSDLERKQILVFDADNKYTGAFGDAAVFDKPVDLAVYADKIYVCDMGKHQILVLNRISGQLIETIGGPGDDKDDQFNRPTHVTVDNQGNIYVTDAFHFAVKKFDPNGKFLQSYGQAGDVPGTFARPKGVAVDNEGNFYVVDAATEVVQIFNSEGRLLLDFGYPGTEIHNLWLPAGISIDYDNIDYFQNFAHPDFKVQYLIYIANMAGPGRTNVYGFGEWTGEQQRLDQMAPPEEPTPDKKQP